MAIPYHTHNFTIPTATKQDVDAGISDSLAVVPSSLGSAATRDVSYFATADQGGRADSAVQPSDLGKLAYKDLITVEDINAAGDKTSTSFLNALGEWKIVNYVDNSTNISVDSKYLTGGGQLNNDISIGLSQTTINSLNKADVSIATGNVVLSDLKTTGTPNEKSYLNGLYQWHDLTNDFISSDATLTTDSDYLTAGGLLSSNINLSFSQSAKEAIAAAKTALQPKGVQLSDIDTTGTITNTSFLSGSGWQEIPGGGDMLSSMYDPTDVRSDAFSMGNMKETATAKILSNDERSQITQNTNDIKNLEAQLAALDPLALVPTGTTIFFDSETAPKGFVVRDGSILKITDFPNLFKILGTRYGGDGVNTFGVGDFREYFIRGYKSSDTTRGLGTQQGDAIRNLTGSFSGTGAYQSVLAERASTIGQGWGAFFIANTINGVSAGLAAGNENGKWADLQIDASRQVPTADENRPKNINLLICIKF